MRKRLAVSTSLLKSDLSQWELLSDEIDFEPPNLKIVKNKISLIRNGHPLTASHQTDIRCCTVLQNPKTNNLLVVSLGQSLKVWDQNLTLSYYSPCLNLSSTDCQISVRLKDNKIQVLEERRPCLTFSLYEQKGDSSTTPKSHTPSERLLRTIQALSPSLAKTLQHATYQAMFPLMVVGSIIPATVGLTVDFVSRSETYAITDQIMRSYEGLFISTDAKFNMTDWVSFTQKIPSEPV